MLLQDGIHTTNCLPETLDEPDIVESTVSDLLDISDSNPLLSSEEEFSEFEMVKKDLIIQAAVKKIITVYKEVMRINKQSN